MSFTRFSWLACLLCSAAFAAEQPPTLRLPDTAAPVSYRVNLNLDPAKNDFAGSISIRLNVKRAMSVLWLNANQIKVQNATLTAGGKSFPAKTLAGGEDFLGFAFDSPIPAGAAEMKIDYTGAIRHGASAGIFEMEDGGEKYLFTQFESTDARDAFPCFDEPAYKVPWQLTLHVPASDKAVSNTPVTSGDNGLGTGTATYNFKETKPLPSYLVALGVGPFEFVEAGTAGKNHAPVRIVTPKGKANEAKYAAEVTATILTRLEEYFGVPFPYEKSDQVAIPVTFGFGAMENAGMVTYAQTLILAKPESDTVARQRSYASVAAHELAHQWFGDLVTTEWWNDIWLNEAFATWMEQKLIAEWKPEWKTRVEDVDSKLGAEQEDSLISARKIRQEIVSKDDISNAFDGITYQKGAAVIGMFENSMGSADFQKGVQSYVKHYAFKNATAPEFLDSLSSGHQNVTKAFSTFLNQAGVPLVSLALDCKNGPTLHLEQQRYLPLGSKGSEPQVWSIPVCVRYGTGTAGKSECTQMTQASLDWKLKTQSCPAWVEANDRGVGYYRVDYQGGLLGALTQGDVEQRLSAPERVDFMGNAQSLAENGKLSSKDALALVNTFHADPERNVAESALTLALEPRANLVPENLQPNYQRFLLKNFQARAEQLGWTPKPGEPDDIRLLRPSLLRAVATWGGDQTLAKQAQELTAKWFDDHSVIDPNMTGAVLATAGYYGDKALYDRFLAEFKKTKDRQVQRRILGALTSFRDKESIESGFAAIGSGEVPFIEAAQLLFAGQGQASTRNLAFQNMKAHFDDLAAKRPQGGGFDAGARFPAVGQSFCDAQSKTELQTFFEPRISKFTGGPRALAQILEGIDLCIATKAAQEASVVSFLQAY